MKRSPIGFPQDPIVISDSDDNQPSFVQPAHFSSTSKRPKFPDLTDPTSASASVSVSASSFSQQLQQRRQQHQQRLQQQKKQEQRERDQEFPIKLFATSQDERLLHSSPLVRKHCMTFRNLLGFGNKLSGSSSLAIDWIIISNYLIDFDYLLDHVPELFSCSRAIVFCGQASGHASLNAWKCCASCSFEMRLLCPSDPPRSQSNPLSYSTPFGVHHTKMFLIGYSDETLRVIIHTANIRPDDIHAKAQAAFIQDFPLKKANSSTETCQFQRDLLDYLATYHHNTLYTWKHTPNSKMTISQYLQRFDFSAAKVVLIPSTPGRHDLDAGKGYLKLSTCIRKHVPQTQSTTTTPIVCQFSSIGSLSPIWLAEFTSALDVNRRPCKPAFLPNVLRFVYPTVEEIRSSVEGYRGGNSVPGTQKNVSKDFLRPLYHRWASYTHSNLNDLRNPLHKPHNVPHIKTYYQLSSDRQHFLWFVLSSHNMSKAAWGEKQFNKSTKRHHIFIRHWELGVFIAPSFFDEIEAPAQARGPTKLVPVSPSAYSTTRDSISIPLPYRLIPEQYSSEDQPWSVDLSYSQADSFGSHSAMG